jgi:predicted nuclease of predicted toxin-antitoxin system
MRFLVDAQLPPALTRWITSNRNQAERVAVADLGMTNASDREIWQRG